MDYEIGDGDELADMAEKLLKGEKKEGVDDQRHCAQQHL